MPKIVGTLLIQNTEIVAQGSNFSENASSRITIPTSVDGGAVAVGLVQASIDGDKTFSFDGGTVS